MKMDTSLSRSNIGLDMKKINNLIKFDENLLDEARTVSMRNSAVTWLRFSLQLRKQDSSILRYSNGSLPIAEALSSASQRYKLLMLPQLEGSGPTGRWVTSTPKWTSLIVPASRPSNGNNVA